MNRIRVSEAARQDLDQIWFYIADDDPDEADKFIRTLTSRFPRLAAIPEMGRKREELSQRLRSFPVSIT
jgi:toxin ParE1/3/4